MDEIRNELQLQWDAPKIDWMQRDVFCLDPDYVRIRNNLLWLQKKAAEILRRPKYTQMLEYCVEDVPLAEFFNAVERNLEQLEKIISDDGYRAKQFYAGDFVWNWEDLNRIEVLMMKLYNDLKTIENGQQMLAFCLGGGELGSFIS